MKKNLLFASLAITGFALFTACGTADTKSEASAKDKDSTSAMKTMPTSGFDYKLVQNKKDPACGMPITAGISDTAHYKEYTLGFCSKECKDSFEKNPESQLAAADIPK